MSEWRQKGFVQDSDEEEDESQIESQHSKQVVRHNGRVDRVLELPDAPATTGDVLAQAQKGSETARVASQEGLGVLQGIPVNFTPKKYTPPRRPSLSPFTPSTGPRPRNEHFESPDPLQSSPSAKTPSQRPPASSTPRRSRTCQGSSQNKIQLRAYAPPSQILGETTETIYEPLRVGGLKGVNASTILGEFGVAALSDDSEDELNLRQESDEESNLSDYPSDLSDTELRPPIAHATPHRRTAVQVVIPSSTSLQIQLAEEQARQRSFRQRKPIQLHPYMLEGELYRREVQSRGLKPVPRARSPLRKQDQQNAESQEEEFNPFRGHSSSPPDPEVFVSTPVARQVRSEGQPNGSNKRRRPNRSQRGSPANPLRVPKQAKRRRPNETLSQALATPARTSESSPIPLDIWSIPPNSPPYSSSPPKDAQLASLLRTRNTDTLPTPSNSSTFHDEPRPLPDSDSDPVPRSAQRSGGELRRPTRAVLSDDAPSGSDEASSASEQEDGELQKVSKKIRGVLPASWLRMDRQAQDQRQAQARLRAQQDADQSSEAAEPQRGVAKKITKPSARSAGYARARLATEGIVIISDESDQESEPSAYRQANNVQVASEDASALAALFDDRYADSGDDLASMEHDRLQLPTLGGMGAKRKRQPKITDAFGNNKKMKPSSTTGVPRSNRPSKRTSGPATHRKHAGFKRARTPLPALSVMDIKLQPDAPQFLKLARRAARRDIHQARQSPSRKRIRLHTAQDTSDANATLRQWQQGLLSPQTKPATGEQGSKRAPLVDATDNRQYTPRSRGLNKNDDRDAIINTVPTTSKHVSRGRKLLPSALQMLQRYSTPVSKPTRRSKITKAPTESGNLFPHRSAPLRTAQLEGDEKVFGRSHRRIAFQKELQRVNQQSGSARGPVPHLNPQLARFLADDDAILPPLPTPRDVEKPRDENPKDFSDVTTMPKRRLRQKPQARRLDVDAREYRQPSEPTFEPVSAAPALILTGNVPLEQDGHALLGLGPYGTRYPITFDVTPLKSDTYFHSDTFVGSEDMRRALSVGRLESRDLDEPAGYSIIAHGLTSIRCGPWSDEAYSQIAMMLDTLLPPLNDSRDEVSGTSSSEALTCLSMILRAIAAYISDHLSFSDPIDRKDFTTKMRYLLQTFFDRLVAIRSSGRELHRSPEQMQSLNRALSFLLVIGSQVHQIARHATAVESDVASLLCVIGDISRSVIKDVVQAMRTLYDFHRRNKLHKERENGIRSDDVLVESVVICMHALELLNLPSLGFWDLVSLELTLPPSSVDNLQAFENVWATIFSLVPFTAFDSSGLPDRSRLLTFDKDNWGCIVTVLKRLLDSYVDTSPQSGSSINEYMRASFTRCYVLINDWHWKRPDQILNAIFDFFGKRGLKSLRRETATGSAAFLQDFAAAGSLTLLPNETAFHIALKCLATGLLGMAEAYPEKKLRSFVFRRIPNHGRTCPKDRSLEEENLVALRNHQDLLSTLYCAVPASCRPKLDRIRDLVSHETSHREACRVSVHAWANLATFQLSTDEPYAAAKPFALWYKHIMHQTLKQYRLARTEADDYLKSGVLDETTKVAALMVKQTMEKNQEQVIATLRDSIAGMKHAIQRARDQTNLTAFLADSDIVHLLELPHLEDRRLINAVRDTLSVLQQYVSMQKPQAEQQKSQPRSEESQDYGDFPDLDDLDDLGNDEDLQTGQPVVTPQISRLDFIQGPLWHLMSNAFGAEHSPDDDLLLACIDTWVLIAGYTVSDGYKDWSNYINPYSQVSWQQLRPTEHTRKFGPYFMATLIARSPASYKEHRQEFLTALMLCLADRESMLKFQHRLLHAIMQVDEDEPLLRNLPFFRTGETRDWDITADSLRSRRLALISSLLANMRDDVFAMVVQEPARLCQVKASYAAMLIDFMNRLKSNYQDLQQGARVAGAYVEFVQKIVQFLKQYTNDICPVLPFFTDSVAFPLPSSDPKYVVGRLCGYAPKVQDPGTAKELCFFTETITQQSAVDDQQTYLVNQLTRALCTDEAPIADRVALRTVFLQGIFPAYIERAFASRVGYLITRPILQCLSGVLDKTIFDLRINQVESLSTAIDSILSVAHAFIRGTEHLKGDHQLLQQPHISSGLVCMFETAASISRLLDYIVNRTMNTAGNNRPPLISYLDELSIYIAQMVKGISPFEVPSYRGDADATSLQTRNGDLLSFCARSLQSNIETNWADDQRSIWFGQGRARREVVFDTGVIGSEKERLLCTIQSFRDTLNELSGEGSISADVMDDIVV